MSEMFERVKKLYELFLSPSNNPKRQEYLDKEISRLANSIKKDIVPLYKHFLDEHQDREKWFQNFRFVGRATGNPTIATHGYGETGAFFGKPFILDLRPEILVELNNIGYFKNLDGTIEDPRKEGDNWVKNYMFDPLVQDAVKKVAIEIGYPKWRKHFSQLDKVEPLVAGAIQRLEGAKTNGELVAAISHALDVEHVHGSMGRKLDMTPEELDELSNLYIPISKRTQRFL